MFSKTSGGYFYREVHSLIISSQKKFFPKNFYKFYFYKKKSFKFLHSKDFPNLYIEQNKKTNFTLKPPKKKEAKKKTLYLAYFSECLRYRLSLSEQVRKLSVAKLQVFFDKIKSFENYFCIDSYFFLVNFAHNLFGSLT